MRALHLVKRLVESLNNSEPPQESLDSCEHLLLPEEFRVWRKLPNRDQRHSIGVLRRFDALLPHASLSERRAALLHDVGKSVSNLGIVARVLVTLLRPMTKRHRDYVAHEEIGRELLRGISDERTLEVLEMRKDDPAARALHLADDL